MYSQDVRYQDHVGDGLLVCYMTVMKWQDFSPTLEIFSFAVDKSSVK